MNKTPIEWTDYTWNPITGCLRGCSYCYARKMAHRFKRSFEPTLRWELAELRAGVVPTLLIGGRGTQPGVAALSNDHGAVLLGALCENLVCVLRCRIHRKKHLLAPPPINPLAKEVANLKRESVPVFEKDSLDRVDPERRWPA